MASLDYMTVMGFTLDSSVDSLLFKSDRGRYSGREASLRFCNSLREVVRNKVFVLSSHLNSWPAIVLVLSLQNASLASDSELNWTIQLELFSFLIYSLDSSSPKSGSFLLLILLLCSLLSSMSNSLMSMLSGNPLITRVSRGTLMLSVMKLVCGSSLRYVLQRMISFKRFKSIWTSLNLGCLSKTSIENLRSLSILLKRWLSDFIDL